MAYYDQMVVVTKDVADTAGGVTILAGERLFALRIDGFGVYVDRMGDLVCTQHSPLGQALVGAIEDTQPATWHDWLVFELGEAPIELLRRTIDILVRDGKVSPSDILVAGLEAAESYGRGVGLCRRLHGGALVRGTST